MSDLRKRSHQALCVPQLFRSEVLILGGVNGQDLVASIERSSGKESEIVQKVIDPLAAITPIAGAFLSMLELLTGKPPTSRPPAL